MNQLDKLEKGVKQAEFLEDCAGIFAKNDKMGSLAEQTFIDLARLADVIGNNTQSTIDAMQIGSQEDTFNRQQLADTLDKVFACVVMTVLIYGDRGKEEKDKAMEYIESIADVILYLEEVYQNLEMSEEFQDLLLKYGNVKNHIDFKLNLKRTLLERIESIDVTPIPEEQLVDPREFFKDSDESKVSSLTRTQIGIGGISASAAGKVMGEILEGESRLAPSVSPMKIKDVPEHIPTARMGKDVIPRPDLHVPKAPLLPFIAEEEATVPPMPPAPLFTEPSARPASTRPAYFNTDDIPPSIPTIPPITLPRIDTLENSDEDLSERVTLVTPIETPVGTQVILPPVTPPQVRNENVDRSPVVNFATTQAPTLPAIEELPGNDNDSDIKLPDVLPSSYKKGPSSRPPMKPVEIAQPEGPAPFTAAWAAQRGAEAGTPAPKSIPPMISAENLFNRQQSIETPEDVQLPSSYLQSLNAAADKKEKESAPEIIKKSHTPEKIIKTTRSKFWRWAGAATVALGLASLVGLIKGGNEDQQSTDTTPSHPSVSAMAAAASAAASASSVAQHKAQQKTAETPTKSGKGIFRIDTKHPSFQAYLCHLKGATGLVSSIKSGAAQAKVSFYQDAAEYQNAQKLGQPVMSGSESEHQQRIAVMEAFINHSLEQSTDSHFIKNYFRHQKNGLENFKATGHWTHDALVYGVDKLYNAIQAPERLTTSSDVVGYAPDPNPSTNPGWKKVDSGAPTFGIVAREAARQMHQPDKAVAYDDFRMIKDATCREIKKIGHSPTELKKLKLGNNADVQNGVDYMYKHWCADDCAPENPLDRALKRSEPVYGEKVQPTPALEQKPATPASSPTPTNLAPQPSHSELDRILPGIPIWRGNVPAAVQPARHAETVAPNKPGLLARAASKVKSFFGFGEKKAVENSGTRMASAQTAPAEPEFTKKDIPMDSWGKTLKDFFWG